MPAVAVAAQRGFGFVDIKTRWTQSLTLRPEGWTVVHVAQVSDFVGNDVLAYPVFSKNQTPAEVQSSLG